MNRQLISEGSINAVDAQALSFFIQVSKAMGKSNASEAEALYKQALDIYRQRLEKYVTNPEVKQVLERYLEIYKTQVGVEQQGGKRSTEES